MSCYHPVASLVKVSTGYLSSDYIVMVSFMLGYQLHQPLPLTLDFRQYANMSDDRMTVRQLENHDWSEKCVVTNRGATLLELDQCCRRTITGPHCRQRYTGYMIHTSGRVVTAANRADSADLFGPIVVGPWDLEGRRVPGSFPEILNTCYVNMGSGYLLDLGNLLLPSCCVYNGESPEQPARLALLEYHPELCANYTPEPDMAPYPETPLLTLPNNPANIAITDSLHNTLAVTATSSITLLVHRDHIVTDVARFLNDYKGDNHIEAIWKDEGATGDGVLRDILRQFWLKMETEGFLAGSPWLRTTTKLRLHHTMAETMGKALVVSVKHGYVPHRLDKSILVLCTLKGPQLDPYYRFGQEAIYCGSHAATTLPETFAQFSQLDLELKHTINQDIYPLINCHEIDNADDYKTYRRLAIDYYSYAVYPELGRFYIGIVRAKRVEGSLFTERGLLDKVDELRGNVDLDLLLTMLSCEKNAMLEETLRLLKLVLTGFSNDELQLFLRWATAMEDVSAIRLHRVEQDERLHHGGRLLPVSYTCSGTIRILPYHDQQTLDRDIRVCLHLVDESMYGDMSYSSFHEREDVGQ